MAETQLAQIGYENYYQMLSDSIRMDAYRKAIFKIVKPGDVVVDLGAGTGLLSIWAIQAGASKVYAIEKTDAIQLAKDIAVANDCVDKIEFINQNSMDVVLPEKANVLLSETLGSFGIDENTLQFIIDARDRFLAHDGVLIPCELELFAAPVEDFACYQKLDFWRNIPDVDFSPAFDLFCRKIMIESVNKNGLLAAPISIGSMDLYTLIDNNFNARVYMQIEKKGTLHGVAGWFRTRLGAGIEIDTSPLQPLTHWKQAFFPFRDAISVIKQDVLDWSVSVGAQQINSDDTNISYQYRCTQLINEIAPVSSHVVPGRNQACHCGSGKKYKHCCL